MAKCAACGAEIAVGQTVALAPSKRNGSPVEMCATCVTKIENIFESETLHARVIPAVALGLAAGLVAALVWYGVVVVTNYQLGIIAIGVGWLVAQAVALGSGGKRGGVLPWMSVTITLVSMTLGEYLVVRHFAVQTLAEEGMTDIPWLLPPGRGLELVYRGLSADPIALLFWIIALWQAYALVRKRKLNVLQPAKAAS